MMILFKPFRNEDTDLIMNFTTYEKAFDECSKSKKKTLNNALVTEFQDQRSRIENAKELAKELLQIEDDNTADAENEDILENGDLKLGVDDKPFQTRP